MFQIIQGSTHKLSDVSAFLKTLGSHANFFEKKPDIFVSRAPGRLDVMGGIADYSGSLVLEMPVKEAALVALQKQDSRDLTIQSLGAEHNDRANLFAMPLDDFLSEGRLIDYAEAQKKFKSDQQTSWAAYAAGAFLVLMRERGVKFTTGAKISIDSKVPEGKGVSSSAAIEVAVMQAIAAAYQISLSPRETAILCQKVENLVVGAPCGIMDQMSSSCGGANQLMAMLCQPAELLQPRPIPREIAFWGIDSGIRHSVGGGDYGSVRTGAFMGYRIIAELAGFKAQETENARIVKISDSRWRGYLANIKPPEFEKNFAEHLPEKISGKNFLERFQGITDTVTRVVENKNYAVLKPTAHPVYENFRVNKFAGILSETMTEENLHKLGNLMFESHESYSACGLGTSGTDSLVELVRQSKNLYGAKITGGGSGGTVAVLGKKGAGEEIEKIAAEYAKQTGYQPYIFSGSSIGAAEFGFLKLKRQK